MTALFGLPEQVIFCKRCCISNQRPNSTVEFLHTADTKKATIAFDADGVCDACRVAEEKKKINWSEREDLLRELLAKHRSKSGAYDVIVPGSGGKDSVFAAHVLKHKYGMHPLLVTWSPGIYTDIGRRNLERWQSIADHILVTPNRDVHRLLTRLALENLFHIFHCFTIGQKAMAPRMAALYDIPLVVYGEGESDYGNPIADSRKPERGREYHSASGPVYLGGVRVDELREKYGLRECDLAPYMPANPAVLERKKVDVRYLGYYIKWHPQSMFYYSVENIGFETAPERTPGTYSKYVSLDDALDDLHYFCTWIKFGIGRATYDAAQEVRSGDITREEAVQLVRKYDGEYPERYEQQVFEYLSVPGFEPMTREYFFRLADKFRSPHLWDGDNLRHVVA